MTELLLISRCPPYPLYLGDRLIVWHLARQLATRGYQIDLVAMTQRAEDAQEQAAYVDLFRNVRLFPETARSTSSYVQRLLMPAKRFPKRAADTWSPDMWQTINELVNQHDYDVVQLFGGVHVYEFAHLLDKLPSVITPYESYSLLLKRQLAQQWALGAQVNQLAAAAYERFMFAPYDHTVVLAEPDRQELRRLNPDLPISVIPNGIDLDAFQPGNGPRETSTLLFVGNYEYAPNLDAAFFLINEVMPRVLRAVPDARLQLVGHAPPPELQAAASEAVDVVGSVPEVQPYLAQATAFVCPLRIGAGIKNKVLEALAMRLPLVGSPIAVDGIDVIDGQSALVAEPDQMADAVIRLLKDRDLQARLATNGRQLIEVQYSWSHVADQYEALYRAGKR